jgi:hypothetical protein
MAAVDNPDVGSSSGTADAAVPTGISVGPLQGDSVFFGDNGLVDCGSTAGDKILTLTNGTSDVVNFATKLTSGATFFKVNPEEGGVPARGKATVQITPKPIPQTSPIDPELYSGTLEITTGLADPPITVRLRQTARGAIIKSTVTTDMNFGDVKVGTPASLQFSLTNSGNLDVIANVALSSSAFLIDQSSTATMALAAGKNGSRTVVFTPSEEANFTDTLAVSYGAGAIHCQPPPPNPTVKGKGSSTVSSITIQPTSLNFGLVDCGSTYVDKNNANAPYQTIVISTNLATTFTPTLGKGGSTPFSLADSSGNAVTQGTAIAINPGAPYTMRIVPLQIPLRPTVGTADNAFGDILTITSPSETTAKTIPLTQTAHGAMLSFEPLLVNADTGAVITGNKLKNDGNNPAPYALEATGATTDPVSGTAQVTPTTNFNITMKADSGFISVKIPPGTPLCRDLPPALVLQ